MVFISFAKDPRNVNVETVVTYRQGEVELGDFSAFKNAKVLKGLSDTPASGTILVDDAPVKIDNRHPDAKLPCPECGDKGFVDLATSREPCNLCTGYDFAKGGIVSFQTRLHENDLAGEILLNPEKRLGVLGHDKRTVEEDVGYTCHIPKPSPVLAAAMEEVAKAAAADVDMKAVARKAASITPQNIGGYCCQCGAPLPRQENLCETCLEKRRRQVMDLARDQIQKGLVKSRDTVGITFDPDGMVITATIKTRADGSLAAQIVGDREKVLAQLAYSNESSYGIVTEKKKPVVTECDECYGTGHWHGIGGPCSKGCEYKD